MDYDWTKTDPTQTATAAPAAGNAGFGQSGEEIKAAQKENPQLKPPAPPVEPAAITLAAEPQPMQPQPVTPPQGAREFSAIQGGAPAEQQPAAELLPPAATEPAQPQPKQWQDLQVPAEPQQQDAKATLHGLLESEAFRGSASNRDRLDALALRDMLAPGKEEQLQAEGFTVALRIANGFKGKEADDFHTAVESLVQEGAMSTVSPQSRQTAAVEELSRIMSEVSTTLGVSAAMETSEKVAGAVGTLATATVIEDALSAPAHEAVPVAGAATPLPEQDAAALNALAAQIPPAAPLTEQERATLDQMAQFESTPSIDGGSAAAPAPATERNTSFTRFAARPAETQQGIG